MAPTTTIAALATPPGTGALSLIRVTGPQALAVASAATRADLSAQPSHTLRHRHVRCASGEVIDDGLLAVFRAPASATGEDCVEFTGHGGILVTRQVLERFLACGARPAGPGEFTQRAFLNGKLDLTQAEAVMDLISAQTALSLRAARGQMEGRLGKRTEALRDELLEALAHLEAWIDFPEEDISPDTGHGLCHRVEDVLSAVRSLRSTADQGRILREGARTVIYGAPNVGKSSLLNHLLGYDRAIVGETAGTTRDTIEETINFHGIPLRLVDTAGVRTAADDVEQQGIERTHQQVESADLILHLKDGSQPEEDHGWVRPPASAHVIPILTKADLPRHADWQESPTLCLSCLTGEGTEALSHAILEILQLGQNDWGDHSLAINARHCDSLDKAAAALEAALPYLILPAWNPELASIDLHDALEALGEIPGKVDTEDLLGIIFSRFCIGK